MKQPFFEHRSRLVRATMIVAGALAVGAASARDQTSTKRLPSGDNETWCVPSPSVRTVRPLPSKFTRAK